MPFQPKSRTGAEIGGRVKSILHTRHLTLYQASQLSERTYGRASPYRLPHNLYYGLRLGRFSPNLYQLFALSRISDYRMADWLRVFGFDLDEIPRLQVLLPTKRTILLDSSLGNPDSLVPWFRDKAHNTVISSVAPLSQLVEDGPPVQQRSLLGRREQDFLYAKIGSGDALAYPDLLPGSIVRVRPRPDGGTPELTRTPSRRLFLVEHEKGLSCCRVAAAGENRILTVSTHLPYAQIGFELHREARVLGVVDLEIRPLARFEQPEVPGDLAKRWSPVRGLRGSVTLRQLLGAARVKRGLSLREASAMSRKIASIFQDERYFMSPSSLSDYEAGDTPPHHIQKVITLCLIFAVPFHTFLETAGVPAAQAGQEPIPERFMPAVPPARSDENRVEANEPDDPGFLRELLQRCEEVPVFLRGAITNICGLTSPSLRSLFWVGGIRSPLHPYLANGLLVSVDRHKQKPVDSRSRPIWQQSLYIVLKRDGTYVCGACGIENGTLVLHPDAEHLDLREEFRNRRDAEIIGQVTAIARRLP